MISQLLYSSSFENRQITIRVQTRKTKIDNENDSFNNLLLVPCLYEDCITPISLYQARPQVVRIGIGSRNNIHKITFLIWKTSETSEGAQGWRC